MSWIYKTFNDNKYKPFLGLSNIVVDICKYMENGSMILLDLVVDLLKDRSNVIHKCPFSVKYVNLFLFWIKLIEIYSRETCT